MLFREKKEEGERVSGGGDVTVVLIGTKQIEEIRREERASERAQEREREIEQERRRGK